MALKFSRVTIAAYDEKRTFLVGGCPQDQNGLNGWTAFEEFTQKIRPDETCAVHVETFLYGDEEIYDATPEEIAYFMKRIQGRPDFIEKRTKKISDHDLIMSVQK